jgi:hypothetical protein
LLRNSSTIVARLTHVLRDTLSFFVRFDLKAEMHRLQPG